MSKSRSLEMDGGYLGVLPYHQKVRVRIRVWVGVRGYRFILART